MGAPGVPRGASRGAPCAPYESQAARMVVLRCVFDSFQRKHAFRLGERPIWPRRAHLGVSKRLLGVRTVQPEEAKSELSCRPQLNFHVFSWSAGKVHFSMFLAPCESLGGPQDDLFGPEGACTAPSRGHKGDPLGGELSSRLDETHDFAEALKSIENSLCSTE